MDKRSLIFSANSLQTYVDCARRFELSYLEGLVWPAVEREPVLKSEAFLANGRIFHEMVHREMLGIPVSTPESPEIARWWMHYLEHLPADIPGKKYPEKTLVGKIGGHVLVATCDLIVVSPGGKVVIFDWKTWEKPKSMDNIRKLLQSRIYPFLLVQTASAQTAGAQTAGAQTAGALPGLKISPEDVTMQYWLAQWPDEQRVLQYSQSQYEADGQYLEALVAEIMQSNPGTFALTEDTHKCKYCTYRSFCDRGDVAGTFEEDDMIDEADLTVELLGHLDDYEMVAF